MKRSLVLFAFLTLSASVFAQSGFLRGKITDGETGEGLYGATVMKQGTGIGVVADFNGNYSLALEPGLHTIVLTFVSYQTQTIEKVDVKSGAVITLDFVMKSAVSELEEVVVTGQALRDSELGITTFQRKSANVVDGISNQSFRRTGDRDLSSAMGRVTGVSIQDGKFVYVRGLGDRYTRTTLNSMTIPGLDPDRNDVQIDIFPTSVLENVIVYKTFSPNLPGDFTGGIVDVETKNFPEVKTTSFSVGFRYNPEMNLVGNNLGYQGGKTDWLGFDDGTRALPFASGTVIPDVSTTDPSIESLTRSLNPQLGPERKTSFLNSSFSFNHGNQINKDKYTIGYTAIFNYQSRFEYFDDVEFGDYTKDDDRSENPFFAEEVRKGELARQNVLWSALLSGALKFDNHTFSATLFRTQNGVSEASDRISRNFDQTQATLYENILTYSQRSVTNGILAGSHQLNKLKVDWKNSLTFARTYDPDFRETAIDISNAEMPTLNPGAGAGIRRFWRDLNEFNENLKIDFSLPYGTAGHKLQFGLAGLYKDRKFDVFNYRIDATTRSGVPQDADYFLQEENIWTSGERQGSYISGNEEPTNNYEAKSSVLGGYVMTEMTLGKLKATYGARVEKADMFYTGQNVRGARFLNNRTLDELNVLPSVNLVYGLSESMNVRGSFGKTLARPSFKEKSAAQIYDPITKRFFNGNMDLTQTMIDNYDLRLENFFNNGDMISLSGFYKHFNGHIELVTFDVATDNVKPRNAGDSRVYGLEFELRKNLDFISQALTNFSLGANITLANSEVDLQSVAVNESGLTELESRQNNARDGEVVRNTRQMAGQSPYLVNAYLNYSTAEGFVNANLSYNVQGESLFIVGVGAVPDVFTQPFHSMNFNLFRDFGARKNHRLTAGVNNILKAERKDFYKGYGGAEAVYSVFRPGRTFSITYGYTF
jgi:TonB-dependent receptor